VIDNYVHHPGLSKQGYGLYIGGDDRLIRNNVVHDAYGFGMHFYSGHNSPDRMLVENNVCFNNGHTDYGKGYPPFPGAGSDFNPATGKRTGDGILLFGGGNNIVRNNICYGNMDWGIRLDGPNSLIANNTVYRKGYQGVYVYPNKNAIVRNNIAYQNRGEESYRGEYFIGSGNMQDHNLFGINPLFQNTAAGDFSLQPGSPAIDAGVAIEGFSTDKNNGARPQGAAWDIGALEFGTAPIQEAAIMNMRLAETRSDGGINQRNRRRLARFTS
jgi:parallel beta-helix repeat protein